MSRIRQLIEEVEGIVTASEDESSPEAAEPAGTVDEAHKAKLGTGLRFAALVKKLKAKEEVEPAEGEVQAEYHVQNPAALAAYIGRKKYGKERFQQMAAAGRKAK